MGEFSYCCRSAQIKTPTRNGYNAQGVNLNFYDSFSDSTAVPNS